MTLNVLLRKAARLLKLRNKIRMAGFVRDFLIFRRLSLRGGRLRPSWKNRYPCLTDRTAETAFDAHYTYHPAWAARILAQQRPAEHIDISSSLHFCTMLSAFIPTRFYDIRPASLHLGGLQSCEGNLMSLPFENQSVASLSCMHVVEHIGLGRYGDPLDPNGDFQAMAELQRVLGRGGSLLFVTPIGHPRVLFNGHRIYSYEQIRNRFAELELHEFSLIPDNASEVGIIGNASPSVANAQAYGCGCFWFKRL